MHSGNEQVMNIMIWAQFQSAIVVIIARGIFLSCNTLTKQCAILVC
jgi:hypothetical protein